MRQRAAKGQPLRIAARDWNDMLDLLAVDLSRRPDMRLRDRDLMLCRNDSGADVDRFGVLHITGVVIAQADNADEFYARPVLKGDEPDAPTDYIDAWAIAYEPIKNGKYGRVIVDGVTPALIDVTDAAHRWATIKDAYATKLASGVYGRARILHKPSGTGDKWCIIRMNDPGPEALYGKLDAALSAGSSATMSIWWHNGTVLADTTENVTVYDWLLGSGESIDSATKVIATMNQYDNRYYVTAAECD